MIKREAKFGVLFRHWLQTHYLPSCALELKQTTTDSIPFSDVKEHQIDALLAAGMRQGILYKAPDDSRAIKPFDYFYLKNTRGFVVIRYPDFFCIIDIQSFCKERNVSDRKSLTAKRAKEIAEIVITL